MTASRPDQPTNQQNITQVQPATVAEEAPIQEKMAIPEPVQQQPVVAMESEKAVQPQPAIANGDLNRRPSARDGPLPALPKEEPITQAGPSVPAIAVPTIPATADPREEAVQPLTNAQDDVDMADPETVTEEADEASSVPREDESGSKQALPPPPPVPQSPPTTNENAPSTPEPVAEKEKWLLPPITPRFKGKKCLVLDLDETLVHSSFKVCLV